MTQPNLYAPPRHPAPPRRRGKPQPRSSQPQTWLVGSIALAALALVPQELWSRIPTPISTQPTYSQSVQPWQFNRATTTQTCQAIVTADQRLSRSQLTQFLSIAKDAPQKIVHETIESPYCTLSKSHQSKQREAYPLEFDPDTWFVVNYDQGIYKGYDFVFKK